MQKKILIVQQELGRYSEAFLYRMLNGFQNIEVEVLVEQHINKHDFPFKHVNLWHDPANFFIRLFYFLRYRIFGYQGIRTAKIRNVIQRINNNNADLVCFQFGFLPTDFGHKIAKINKPFCIIHHGTDINQAIEDKAYHQRLKLVWKQANTLIFVSHFLMKIAIKLGCPEHKACVNYLGVPDFEYKRLSRTCDRPFKFILVARMVHVKNHINIIHAFSRAVKASSQSIQLILIGTGLLEYTIKEQISKLGLQKNIFILGNLGNGQVIKEIAKADCVVLASIIHSIKGIINQQEGLGISLLEGARLGLPIIGSNTGGIPEIIDDNYNGYLIDPLDIEDIKNAMLKIIENPRHAKTMGENGKMLVREKFDFSVQMRKFENIFIKIETLKCIQKKIN
jgi:glycosyltransferase involved in cell wall biosynthesis